MTKTLLSVVLLGATVSFSANAVVGSQLADPKEYPFYARLGSIEVEIDKNRFNFNDFCGGTILDKNHILTAAHCFNKNISINTKTELYLGSEFAMTSGSKWYSFKAEDGLRVVVYNYHMNADSVQAQELKEIDKIIIHPDTIDKIIESVSLENNPLITQNDMVVVKLKSPILDNVQSIDFDALENSSLLSNEMKSIGFGSHFEVKCEAGKQYEFSSVFHNGKETEQFFECQEIAGQYQTKGYRDSKFRDATTAFLSKDACDNLIGSGSSVILGDGMNKEQSLCYGHPDTIVNDQFVDTGNPLLISTVDNTRTLGRSCTFDSGSPLVSIDGNGFAYPIGVVSYDTVGACAENGISVAMDLSYYKDWIIQSMKVAQNDEFYENIPTEFNNNSGDYILNTIQHSKGDGLTVKEASEKLGLIYVSPPISPEEPDTDLPTEQETPDQSGSGNSGGSLGLLSLLGLSILSFSRKQK